MENEQDRRRRDFRAGQVHPQSAGRARLLRIQGIRRLGRDRDQREPRRDRSDPGQSGNDQRLQGRHAGNGKPFPDGAKMAKIHWNPKKLETFPAATVPGAQHDVDFMVKDSKRFADSGGWGWGVFDYDAASDTFTPGTLAGTPPQGNDAKCGFACHATVKTRDYVFTDYGHR